MSPIHVLIVDDSEVMRKLVTKTLNLTSYKADSVFEAGDGEEALRVFEANPNINLILCDWNMPKMDGLTFIQNIRSKNQKVVVLMVTTEGTSKKMEQALQMGADNYVVKPFNEDELARKLKKAFISRS